MVAATAVLLLHMTAVEHLSDAASRGSVSPTSDRALRIQLVADAGAAAVVLVGTTALGVYKPRGLTAYGRRRRRRDEGW